MGARSISNGADIATEETNMTGVSTTILEIDPDSGTLIKLLNNFPTGDSAGLPLFFKLNDSNDDPLPTDTSLVLTVLRPTDDEPVAVAQAESNIAAWNQLSISEQRNSDNIDSVKIELNGDAINVRDKDFLRVQIDASAQIDWSNSEFYIPRQAVRELPFEG